jgi:hypothetical protein
MVAMQTVLLWLCGTRSEEEPETVEAVARGVLEMMLTKMVRLVSFFES